MKKLAGITVIFLLMLVWPASAQTFTSMQENVIVTGAGFAAGDTLIGEPSGMPCENIVVVSATEITATCPDGTASVTIVAPPPPTTYAFVLCANACNPKTPTSLTFAATVGGATPAAQTLDIFDTSPNCPPVKPVPYCAWPGTTVTSDSAWLKVSPASGTTEFNDSVSVVLTGLAAGTYKGNITITQKLFTTPTLKVPVTLTVTGGTVVHQVALSWSPGTPTTGSTPATSFNVDRAATTAGPFTQIGTTASLAYTDLNVTGGGSYCYQVFGEAPTAVPPVSPPSNTLCVTVPGTATKRSFWKRFKHLF